MRTLERIPDAVRAARAMWFLAIAAGVLETALVVAGGEADGVLAGVTVRALVFGAAVLVVLRMAAGRNWARWTLTVALGVLGTLSMIVDPVLWLLDGNSPPAVIAGSGPVDLLFGASRMAHVAAVVTATALMFVPSSAAYFRHPG